MSTASELMAVMAMAVLISGFNIANAQNPLPYATQSFVSSQDTAKRRSGVQSHPLISVDVKSVSLRNVLHDIARQAKLDINYGRAEELLGQKVSLQFTKLPLEEALSRATRETGVVVTFSPDRRSLIVQRVSSKPQSNPPQGSTGIVTGRVRDSASGVGVNGVTVTVLGTELRTTTNNAGEFTLKNIPLGNQTLQVRQFGYKTVNQTVEVLENERVSVNLFLVSVPTVLSGVVTTAVGTQERVRIGNDVTVLNVDSIMRVAPINTVTDMLEARVPGLIVLRSSGQPGAPSRIRLRGVSSITRGNDPILIVDGVRVYMDQSNRGNILEGGRGAGLVNESDPDQGTDRGGYNGPSLLDQIDPNSIETIEVFKGPSASALYGADAGNGVIVITTKKGQVGKTRWSTALESGRTSQPGRWWTNYFPFGVMANGSGITCDKPYSWINGAPALGTCVIDSVIPFQALNDDRFTVLGTGRKQSVSLSVSGGKGPITYQMTGSIADETGYLKLSNYEIDNFAKLHGFPAPNWMRHPDNYINRGGTSQVNYQVGPSGGFIQLNNSLLYSEQQQSSLQNALSYLQNNYDVLRGLQYHSDGVRPITAEYYERAMFRTWTLRNSINTNWSPLTWFPVVATYGIDFSNRNNSRLLPRGYIIGDGDSVGKFGLMREMGVGQTVTLGTTLRRQSGGRLPGIRIPVGFNLYYRTANNFSGLTTGIPIEVNEPSIIAETNGKSGNARQSSSSNSTFGWYIAPSLDINGRFFFNPGFRLDGGSASGSRVGFSGFPKLDFSWIAVDRQDDPLYGVISQIRPRIAFGVAGIQPEPSDRLRTINVLSISTRYLPDGSAVTHAGLWSLGNTLLRPERSREFEGGLDLDLWNQSLTLTVTGYRKVRYDALVPIPVAPSVYGGARITRNIGTVQNQGVEAAINARVFDTRSLGWNVAMNLSKHTNEVKKLAPGIESIDGHRSGAIAIGGGGWSRIVPGYPLNGIWAEPIVGFVDADNNGFIDPSEIRVGDSAVYLGAPFPNYELSLSTTLSLFNGRVNIATSAFYQNGLTQQNQAMADIKSFLTKPGLGLSEQAALVAFDAQRTEYGVVQTVSTFRWNALSLTYQIPQEVTRRLIRASSGSISLQGSNLALQTNYRGKDPNVSAYSSGNGVVDRGQLPMPRVWQLRMTLGW